MRKPMALEVGCLFSTIQSCESNLHTSQSFKGKENNQSFEDLLATGLMPRASPTHREAHG